MLFLVETRHDGAHCPGYHPELLPPLVKALESRDEIAKRTGVKLHGVYSKLPEHGEIAIAEAASPAQVAAFIVQLMPIEQADIRTTALTSAEELLALARQMTG